MTLPEDLKSFKADAFQLFTPEQAGIALAIIFMLCLVLDRLGSIHMSRLLDKRLPDGRWPFEWRSSVQTDVRETWRKAIAESAQKQAAPAQPTTEARVLTIKPKKESKA